MSAVRHHNFATIDKSVAALADRPLLTIFGENNDPLGFQPTWAEHFADMEQVEVPGGNHFPMCDAPGLVANAIRNWHGSAAGSGDSHPPSAAAPAAPIGVSM